MASAPRQPALTVLDSLTYAGYLANLAPVSASPRLRFVRGDIADAQLVRSLVPGHDAVINFAAETHVDRSISGAAPFVATNVAGMQVLLQACLEAGVGPVVQVSTDEVYGSIASGSWTEQAPLRPNSPYSAAKAGGDLIAGAYARTYGLDLRITRCCNNYGPYQYPEKVIPLFVTNCSTGTGSRCTVTAATSAAGSTSMTTAGGSSWCSSAVGPGRRITSAATLS